MHKSTTDATLMNAQMQILQYVHENYTTEVTRTSWKSKGVVKGSQGPQGPSPLDKEQPNVRDTGSTRTTRNF